MDLLENPFHMLNATPRDNRKRILELAEDRSLLHGSDDCSRARSDLTNPRKRLEFEVAWLPGVGPRRTAEVLSLLESAPSDLLTMSGLTPMSRVNALAAGLKRLPESTPEDIATWILEIAHAFEDIDPGELSAHINEDRLVSGFPAITEVKYVQDEIDSRRRYCSQVFKLALNILSASDLVEAVTMAVESATDCGESEGPTLVHDLAETYEVEAQGFLEKETRSIQELVQRIRHTADAGSYVPNVASMVGRLASMVKNWDLVAQPVQVSKKSQGMPHTASHDLAMLLRELAVHLNNVHGRVDLAQELTRTIQEVFAEVGEVAERAAEDANTLTEIAQQSRGQTGNALYSGDLGGHRGTIVITADRISWARRALVLQSITRTAWGGAEHNSDGSPRGGYRVALGTESDFMLIRTEAYHVYANIVDRIWGMVGTRLLDEVLRGLLAGRDYKFGSAVLHNSGMELRRGGLLQGKERVFCRWDELRVDSIPGTFVITRIRDRNTKVALSYAWDDNVHVLEAAVRSLMKLPLAPGQASRRGLE